MMSWGYPPDPDTCTEIQTPPGIVTKVNQSVLKANSEGMHVRLGKPAPRMVVTRQLLRKYHHGRGGPFKVMVPGYGTFRCGEEGWCWDESR